MKHTDVKLQMIRNADKTYSAVIKEKDASGKRWLSVKELKTVEKRHPQYGLSLMLVDKDTPDKASEEEDLVFEPIGYVSVKPYANDKTGISTIIFKARCLRHLDMCFPVVGGGPFTQNTYDCFFDAKYYNTIHDETGEPYWRAAVKAGKFTYKFSSKTKLQEYDPVTKKAKRLEGEDHEYDLPRVEGAVSGTVETTNIIPDTIKTGAEEIKTGVEEECPF